MSFMFRMFSIPFIEWNRTDGITHNATETETTYSNGINKDLTHKLVTRLRENCPQTKYLNALCQRYSVGFFNEIGIRVRPRGKKKRAQQNKNSVHWSALCLIVRFVKSAKQRANKHIPCDRYTQFIESSLARAYTRTLTQNCQTKSFFFFFLRFAYYGPRILVTWFALPHNNKFKKKSRSANATAELLNIESMSCKAIVFIWHWKGRSD